MTRPSRFEGTIGRTLADSEAVVRRATASRCRRAERGDRPARRHRVRPVRLLRLRHRHAEHRRARGRRSAVHQLPRHPAVLADTGVAADRAIAARRRHARGVELPHRVSRTCSATSPTTPPPSPRCLREEGYATFCVGKWHLAPMEQCSAAGPVRPVAARSGLRPVLRLHGGRDRPVPSRTGLRQPSDRRRRPARRTAITCPRISSTSAADDLRLARACGPTGRSSPTSPFGATHAPHQAPARVHGEVPRAVRRGLGRRASALVRTPARARRDPRRAPSSRRATPASTPGTTCPRTSSGSPADSRRRSPPSSTTPTTRSAGSSTVCAAWANSTTPCSSCSPTTARPRRAGRSG